MVVLLSVLAALVAAPVPAAPPSAAQPALGTLGGAPVWPGLYRDQRTVRLSDGSPVVVNVLHFRSDDPSLELRPVLAQGRVPGLETVTEMGRRLYGEGAVAGVNGGFWLASPVGEPNGYWAVDGELVSESETQGRGPRGTAAFGGGGVVMDRVSTRVSVVLGDGLRLPVAGVNRGLRPGPAPGGDGEDALLVYTPRLGPAVLAAGASAPVRAYTLGDVTLPASGRATGVVAEVADATGREVPIPAGGVTLLAYGRAADGLATTGVGATVELDVTLLPVDQDRLPAWAQVVHGLAAGPLIVKDAVPTDPADWEDEGFAPDVHSLVRAPRSAIGVTSGGETVLLTADGRRPGYSAGLTIAELATTMISLGAVEALSLDGGGSSQFVVDGLLRNLPCCDAATRPVANGLFVFHDYRFTSTERLAGAGRAETAAEIALAAYPDGAPEVLVASGEAFPDALAGGALAAEVGGPLLLTARDALPPATIDALALLRPETVTILGGFAAVAGEVEKALDERYAVRRLAGAERTATAAAIARRVAPRSRRAFLASEGGFADALVAAVPAGLLGEPVLLSRSTALPAPTRAYLRRARVEEVVIVGGRDRIGPGVVAELRRLGIAVARLAGSSRYGTARAVTEWTSSQRPGLEGTGLVVATGDDFPDALAGGPLAVARRQPLMIVPAWSVLADPDAAAYLEERAGGALERVTLLGGLGVLSSYQEYELDQLALRPPAETATASG